MPRLRYQPSAVVLPVLVPLLVRARLAEELQLRLLEFAGAEDEGLGGDLVAEALADLGDAERGLTRASCPDVAEVGEDALRGLRPQVVQALLGLHGAQVGLEQPVEHPRLGVGAARSAVRARDLGEIAGDELLAGALAELLGKLVDPGPMVVHRALHQRINESLDVPGGLPDLRRQDHRRVQPDHVVPAGDHRLPPLPFDVLLQLHPERAVVPGRPGAAVDLTAGLDEPSALAEADHGVDLG